jgi:hypothetical protein
MATTTDDADVAARTPAGETITDWIGVLVGSGIRTRAGLSIDSGHVSGRADVTYVAGCRCCQNTTACRQGACPLGPDGYAPYFYGWQIEGAFFNGFNWSLPVLVTFANGVNSGSQYLTVEFFSTGDCEWTAFQDLYTTWPGASRIYFRLYYDSGYKLYVDYYDPWNPPYPAAYPGPTGNQVVFSLDTFDLCPPGGQSVGGAPATGGSQSTLTLFSGSPQSVLDPAVMSFFSCGCSRVTVPCCTEKIPRYLSLVLTGATLPGPSPMPLENGSVAYGGSSFWSGLGFANSNTGGYRFLVTCSGVTWNLKIYDLSTVPATLVYDEDASTAICYPIYLSFPQTAFDFGGAFAGQTFTIDFHA